MRAGTISPCWRAGSAAATSGDGGRERQGELPRLLVWRPAVTAVTIVTPTFVPADGSHVGACWPG